MSEISQDIIYDVVDLWPLVIEKYVHSLFKVLSIGSHILSQLEPEAFGPQKTRGQLAAQGFFADQMPRALIMTI